jgi:tetratricopeptide (TPR) repeat protein
MLYEYLSKKNPENINYKYRLAITYGLINKPDEAIKLLEEINEETPGLLYIVKKLGHAYDIKKEFSKARAYFKYALRMDPGDMLIQNRLKVYDLKKITILFPTTKRLFFYSIFDMLLKIIEDCITKNPSK